MFIINVRNPSYRSLVRDQKQYIQHLEAQIQANNNANEKNIDEKSA